MRADMGALARLTPDKRQNLLKYALAVAGETAGSVGLLRMDKSLVVRESSEPRANLICVFPETVRLDPSRAISGILEGPAN
jgi:hypothetical protein